MDRAMIDVNDIDGKYGFAVYIEKKSDNTGKHIGNNLTEERIAALIGILLFKLSRENIVQGRF